MCLFQETAGPPCRRRGLEPGAAFTCLAWARLVVCVSSMPAMLAIFPCACWPLVFPEVLPGVSAVGQGVHGVFLVCFSRS